MILKHHAYRLAVNGKVQASAGTLADCRTMADYLFLRDPNIDQVTIFAWCCDHPRHTPGWTIISQIELSLGHMLALELKQPGYMDRRTHVETQRMCQSAAMAKAA